jgi:hypothetical protein
VSIALSASTMLALPFISLSPERVSRFDSRPPSVD